MKIALISVALYFLFGCSDDSDDDLLLLTDIFRGTGAVQCENEGRTSGESAAELAEIGIDVLNSQCGNMTGVVITVCGAGTTAINIHRVYTANLPQAEELGFSPLWQLRGEYSIEPCDEEA